VSESPRELVAEPEADARRIVLADLVGRLVRVVTDAAGRYEAAAGRAEGALRRALEALGRAKQAQAAELAPLARALGASATPAAPGLPEPPLPAWGVIFGEAFEAERDVERIARELLALTTDPSVRALAGRLAVGASAHRGEVRRLYLRYT
jgi:hypothetical protein